MDSNESTNANQPSCSYSPPVQKFPQGIMKSTPKIDKIVVKIWNQPNHGNTDIDNSSVDDFPIQPPIKQIEVVYLDSTTSENTNNAEIPIVNISEDNTANNPDAPVVELTEDTPPSNNNVLTTNEATKEKEDDPPANDEEHKTPDTSPAKNSISSIHTSDFYNPDEF